MLWPLARSGLFGRWARLLQRFSAQQRAAWQAGCARIGGGILALCAAARQGAAAAAALARGWRGLQAQGLWLGAAWWRRQGSQVRPAPEEQV
jgi:hypothetical protein